ncbi:hypothetical protein F0562_002765 [Nyssa sinensis]|uniref:Uncharacterized protein n=1 Tax=Nyssa sinensis TaxID=561372 RepID=A0A5J5BUV9_9ASTE|nr:hypothetical protein F0562_002765 [Nyssa sinensis]
MDSSSSQSEFDCLFKLLMIGDSGVGKSSLLLSFTSDTFEDLSPTIGVDFKVKHVTIGGKKLKLAIWDTAGQERFRTLTSSYYRGAQGVIMVYDVTRRETFTNLSDIWAKEIDLYSTNEDCIKMLVGNKVDKESDRVVTKKEGIDFARQYGCLFIECSAKTRTNVEQCFEELVLKILDTPSLVAQGSTGVKKNIFKQKPPEPDASTMDFPSFHFQQQKNLHCLTVVQGSGLLSSRRDSGSSNLRDPEIEEEYQIQLALELSAREDPEAVQIEAVKQISLGSCPPENTPAEVIAYRYWGLLIA